MTIGTDSHVPTVVNLNSASDFDGRIKDLAAKIEEYNANEIRLSQYFARIGDLKSRGRFTADMVPDLERAAAEFKQIKDNREQVQKALAETKEEQIREQSSHEHSYITCKGHIHVGVSIQIGPLVVPVNTSVMNSRVQIVDGDISFLSN
jgi:hypothetical protein